MSEAVASEAGPGSHDSYKESLMQATRQLGGTWLSETWEVIEQAGHPAHNPQRVYHTLEHFHDISRAPQTRLLDDLPPFAQELRCRGMGALYETVAAVMMRAGAHHDIVYHVDRDYAPAALLRHEDYRILPPRSVDAPQTDYKVTAAEPEGDAGIVLDMARTLFDVLPNDTLTQFGGKNEFLSAVYAGIHGLKEGIPLKYLLAEMMMIEATRPFEAPERMNRLRARFETANRLLPASGQLDAQEIEAFLLGATQLANIDVFDFARNFGQFLKGSVKLLCEAGRTIACLEDFFVRAGNREAFFLNLLHKLQGGEASVFHALSLGDGAGNGFPSCGALAACGQRAQENIRKDILMSRALKIAAALTAAIEVTHGENAIEAIPDRLTNGQRILLNGYPAIRDPDMTETAVAMRDAIAQHSLFAPASYLLAHLDEPNLLRLSEKVSRQYQACQERFTAAFATRKTAQELLEFLGQHRELRSLESLFAQSMGYPATPPRKPAAGLERP